MGGRPGLRAAPMLVGPLAILTAMSVVGTAMSPVLLVDNPLLLVLLSPRVPYLLVAARSTPMWTFVVLVTVRLCLNDPFHFGLGVRYGSAALHWSEARFGRLGNLLRKVEQLVSRFGVLAIILRPNGPALMAAGAAGIRPARALPAAALGTVGYVVCLFGSAGPTAAGLRAAQSTATSAPVWVLFCAASLAGAAIAAGVVALRRRRTVTQPALPELEPALV